MQRVIENGITTLKADDGMYLTDGESFVTTVILGKDADGAEWYEITEEEGVDMPLNDDLAVFRHLLHCSVHQHGLR